VTIFGIMLHWDVLRVLYSVLLLI